MNQESVKEFLIEHSHSSRNGQFPKLAQYSSKITNPLCGDHVELRIHSDGEIIHDIGFLASSCAICSASASLLAEFTSGKKITMALQAANHFEQTLTKNRHESWPVDLKPLACFEHLRVNPSRLMCALLPWVVLKSALNKKESICK